MGGLGDLMERWHQRPVKYVTTTGSSFGVNKEFGLKMPFRARSCTS